MSNDIAILVLNETVNLTSTWHKSICLPQSGDPGPPIDSVCVITGWGAIGQSFALCEAQILMMMFFCPDGYSRTPDILQQAHLRILDDDECDEIAEDTPAIREQFICAGRDHDRENACYVRIFHKRHPVMNYTTNIHILLKKGDSGGPLTCFVGHNWVQYGITSFGTGTCGERTFYSNISLYLDGIHAGW